MKKLKWLLLAVLLVLLVLYFLPAFFIDWPSPELP